MRASQKKLLSAILICALLIGGGSIVAKTVNLKEGENEAVSVDAADRSAKNETDFREAKTDLIFWYANNNYTEFFDEAAKQYYLKTGIKVAVEYQDTIDYIGDMYQATMEDAEFPDAYLISGDYLEEVYLYGLACEREKTAADENILSTALKAAAYQDRQVGYPLSYNTCVLVYQKNFFQTEPQSLQEIITYADETDPGENVEYLLEWDVSEAFYDFPLISNSVTFDVSTPGDMQVIYDEALYQRDLEFFEKSLSIFSLDASRVSESIIVEDFLAGRTLCAILDTNSLHKLTGYDYGIMQIPNLNEELRATSCATTDMLLVNGFSENAKAAAAFAEFVTIDMAEILYDVTGYYSVIPSAQPDFVEQVANQVYETAVPVPSAKNAKDFWVSLEETILKYF
ncbi:MAG: extracellular solute-binding protein [Roseburia sp.]